MPTSSSLRGFGMRWSMRASVSFVILFLGLMAAGRVLAAERFEGLVEPYLEVKISSGVPGILDEVLVQRGDFVKKDQVLARLQSDVEKATCDLTRAKAEFAARKAKRNQELAKRQMITSPVDGVVVKRSHSPGEFVQEDVILNLAQINPLRVEVVVPIKLYGKITVGMRADVEWEAPMLGLQRAVVKVVDPVVDAASGTIGIRLELPNPKHELPAGTKCWVRFPIAAERPAGKLDPARP